MGVEVAGTGTAEEDKPPAKEGQAKDKPASAKKMDAEEKPYWQQHLEEGSGDRSRTAAVLIVTVIAVIIILSAVLVAFLLRPQPKTVYSELSVSSGDVDVLASTPSGDNKTAIVPVQVELKNAGEGKSGVINVWIGAYNRTNEILLVSEFNTTDLRRVDNGQVVNFLEPTDKGGSIAKARGNLSLPPGDYRLKLKIYEDGGKRTLVYGYMYLKVDQSMVAKPDQYVPEGGGRGNPVKEGGSALPGFEAPLMLAAAAAVLMLLKKRRG